MKNINEKDLYIVYIVRHRDKVMYIGSGKRGRELHCTSGISHCYELNELHFNKKKMDVEVVNTFSTKEDSLSKEKELIDLYWPLFNISSNASNAKAFISRWKTYFMSLNGTRKWRYNIFMEALIKEFGAKSLVDGISIVDNLHIPLIRTFIKRQRVQKQWEFLYTILVCDNILQFPINPPILYSP